jgi:hypothetical protein
MSEMIIRSAESVPTYRCPCCKSKTLHGRGRFELCPVCYWEDDGQDDPYADEAWGGPNSTLSLTEARKNFATVGAMEPQFVGKVRKPRPEEL